MTSLPQTASTLLEISEELELMELALKTDIEALTSLLHARDSTPSRPRPSLTNSSPSSRKIRVTSSRKVFRYKSVDEILEKVVPEEAFAKMSLDGRQCQLERILSGPQDYPLLDGISVIEDYLRTRRRQKPKAEMVRFTRDFDSLIKNENDLMFEEDRNLVWTFSKFLSSQKSDSIEEKVPRRIISLPPLKETQENFEAQITHRIHSSLISDLEVIFDFNFDPDIIPRLYKLALFLQNLTDYQFRPVTLIKDDL